MRILLIINGSHLHFVESRPAFSLNLDSQPPMHAPARTFPPFSLTRLLSTVFAPKGGERVAILIDLPEPEEVTDFRYLKDPVLTIQRHAYEDFYQGLQKGACKELGLTGADFFAFEITGGSNLDPLAIGMPADGDRIRESEERELRLCVM